MFDGVLFGVFVGGVDGVLVCGCEWFFGWLVVVLGGWCDNCFEWCMVGCFMCGVV